MNVRPEPPQGQLEIPPVRGHLWILRLCGRLGRYRRIPKPSILAGPETKTYPMPVPLTPPEEKTPGPFDLKRYETRSPYSPEASEKEGTLAGRIAAGLA
jgi:hypothetical protein